MTVAVFMVWMIGPDVQYRSKGQDRFDAEPGVSNGDLPEAGSVIESRKPRSGGDLARQVDEPRFSITGIVVDVHGSVVSGATVRALCWPSDRSGLPRSNLRFSEQDGIRSFATEREVARTRSGVDGRFEFRVAFASEVLLAANAPGFSSERLNGVQMGADVKIQLHPAVSLRVTTLDHESNPIASMVILRVRTAGFAKPFFELTRQADQAGTAYFADLPALRSAGIVVRAPAHVSAYRRIELPEFGTANETLQLILGAPVTGVVRSATTSIPIEGALVGRMISGDVVSTDSAGRFVLHIDPKRFADDRRARPLQVWAPGYGVRRFKPRTEPVDIALEPLHDVRGRVVDPKGRPLANVKVRVAAHSPQFGPLSKKPMVVSEGTGTTDELGVYRIRAGFRGRLLTILAASPTSGVAALDVRPEADKLLTLVPDIVLLPELTIQGVVVPPEGRTLDEVSLWLHGEDHRRRSRTWTRAPAWYYGHLRRIALNRDGSFQAGNLAAGTYELRARVAPGYTVVANLRLTESRSDLVFRLPPGQKGIVNVPSMSDPVRGRVVRLEIGGLMVVKVPDTTLVTHGSVGAVLRDGVVVGHIQVKHGTREALLCHSLAEDRASIGRQFAVAGDVVEFK